MNYLTGRGFIGTKLYEQVTDTVHIPHEEIPFIRPQGFESFFFLSSYGNLASQTDEMKVYQANIEDLLDTLYKIRKINFKSFVFMSSSSVMLKKQTTYSRCKKAAEEILLAFMESHNAPMCIIRPFSVTGVGEQREHLIPTLIRSCLKGELVNFDPTPTHDFIDVDDVVAGILSLSRNSARGIFQLGTGIKYSNQDVLETVEKVTGKKANINVVHNIRDYDNDNWVSTNFKARGYGWLPQKTLEQSIKEMVVAYEG